MNSKQRNVILQRWIGALRGQAHDLNALDQVGGQALADSEVCRDADLQGMIREEIHRRRAQLENEAQERSRREKTDTSSPVVATPPPPAVPPQQVRQNFNTLVLALTKALERTDESETHAVLLKMRALHEQSPDVISLSRIKRCERRVQMLHTHIQQTKQEIVQLGQQAVTAAREGNADSLTDTLRQLAAIHATHPLQLTDARMEEIRREVVQLSQEREQHEKTLGKLLDRERELTREIKCFADAVRAFHEVSCRTAHTSSEYQTAKNAYLRVIKRIGTYDAEWFTGIVLELADLLAEWTVPPPGAGRQIDKFLDELSTELDRIRAAMRNVNTPSTD